MVMLASTTPTMTNGGRAERWSKFAYHNAAAPIANVGRAKQAAANTKRLDRSTIHAFAEALMRDRNNATTGMRTRASDAASSVFFTRNAPGSFIPLAANDFRSHN